MTRWCALLLLLIAIGLTPVAQALPCVLHTNAVSSPCPHETKTTAQQTINRVADCFLQAAPLPEAKGTVSTFPTLSLPFYGAQHIAATPLSPASLVAPSSKPPPPNLLAWFGQRRI